jgi:sec-independent protein translocase protein TatA
LLICFLIPARPVNQTLYPSGMPGWIGLPELLILLVVVLIFFGPKRLPEMGRSLGRGMREFKESVTGNDRDDEPAALPTATVTTPDATPVTPTPTPQREHDHTA